MGECDANRRLCEKERARYDYIAKNYPTHLGKIPADENLSDVTGVVYFFGAYEDGSLEFVKIGYTDSEDPFTRLKGIQQGVPFEMRLLAATAGCRTLELSYFEEFKATRVRGEWFRPSAEILGRVQTLNLLGSWETPGKRGA